MLGGMLSCRFRLRPGFGPCFGRGVLGSGRGHPGQSQHNRDAQNQPSHIRHLELTKHRDSYSPSRYCA